MKSFLITAALVFGGIWLWARLTRGTKMAPKVAGNTVPVDTGVFYGPYIDPKTGAYLGPGDTSGAVGYPTQPIGVQ